MIFSLEASWEGFYILRDLLNIFLELVQKSLKSVYPFSI